MQAQFSFADGHPSWEHSHIIPNQYIPTVEHMNDIVIENSKVIPFTIPVVVPKLPVKVVNLSDNKLPEYSHEYGDSGMDVRAFVPKNEETTKREIHIYPKEVKTIKTGLYVEIPIGYEIQVRPRSGLANIYINLANCVGTIDANYRGEIMLMLYNFGTDRFVVENGDRIGQLVLSPVLHMVWDIVESVDDLTSTNRGYGGFGHTGVK